MSLFQILALSVLLVFATSTLSLALRGSIRKRMGLFWLTIWSAGIAAVVFPHSTVVVARVLGVGRGADLVLYCSVVAMFVGFFYIYGRFRRLDRQLTVLVRQLAIENALRESARPDEAG